MSGRPKVLITGGCGFIGINVAERFLERGWRVSAFDDLSRPGTERNLERLKRRGGFALTRGDIRDPGMVARWVRRSRPGLRLMVHLAAQVAVTGSVADPRRDFEINALGTLNLLEALRASAPRVAAIYASTNKVYGAMESVRLKKLPRRYAYAGGLLGVPESMPLDFHSPYGCSKGAADQYFRDYHRIYGLPTVVFRQSCIYGPHQRGNEDQGWVAHFMKQALAGRGVTLYGDGRQVRDLLYVSDLVDAFERAHARRAVAAGRVYNIGGGPENTLSLLELLDWIADKLGRPVPVRRRGWRPGDQRVYISDISASARELGWRPEARTGEGLERLWGWLKENA